MSESERDPGKFRFAERLASCPSAMGKRRGSPPRVDSIYFVITCSAESQDGVPFFFLPQANGQQGTTGHLGIWDLCFSGSPL